MKDLMRARSLILILVPLATVAILKAAQDPFAGIWELDLAKSKFGSTPPPKSTTLKIESLGNEIRVYRDGVEAQGKAVHWEFVARFDGKDYPVNGDSVRDTVSLKRIDAYTIETSSKKGGKVTNTPLWTVSEDGGTLMIAWAGRDAQGKLVDFLRVYDKQ